MKKIIIPILSAVLVLAFLLPAFSQEDITKLADPAFTKPERAAAVFMHDAHNEKAGIEDCTPCHHEGKENGVFTEGDPEQKCSSCHTVEGEGKKLPLMLAYHKMCVDCHVDKAKGPLACGQCHVK